MLDQFEVRLESAQDLLDGGAVRRLRAVIWDEVMNGQEVTVGFEPAEHGLEVEGSVIRSDGTVKGVFKYPVEELNRVGAQEIKAEHLP